MIKVAFNGKFLSAAPTGVHRVAAELISAVDRIVSHDAPVAARYAFEILAPPDARADWPLQRIPQRTLGPLTWQPWEQLQLPLGSGGRLLVNLCNLAPLFRAGAVTMIHDAQVFISPESYSPQFRAWYRFALPKIGRISSRILTVSEFSRRMLAHYGVAPLEKISVIHNGAEHIIRGASDPQVLQRLGLEPRRYVAALANVQKHKNIGLLFKALQEPAMKGAPLVLAGADDGAAFEAAGLAPPPGVIFTGRVSDGQMRAVMENAACFAFPSTTEGFGLPPLEAMRLGCPAVLAPCGALPEVYGDNALYAEPGDPAAWAKAMASYIDDSKTRAQAGEDARRYAATFTWDRAARRMLEVFEDLERPLSRAA